MKANLRTRLKPIVSGMACLATPAGADATVQITLVDNFITERGNSLNADISGDGVDDLAIAADFGVGGSSNTVVTQYGNSAISGFGSAFARASPYGFASTNYPFGTFNPLVPSGVAQIGLGSASAYGMRVHFEGYVPNLYGPLLVHGLYPITFTDSRFGGTVNAWLDIESEAYGETEGARVSLLRVLWDETDPLNRPAGLSADDPAYDEAIPAPEPTALALLAMGAAGVLTRRRRR